MRMLYFQYLTKKYKFIFSFVGNIKVKTYFKVLYHDNVIKKYRQIFLYLEISAPLHSKQLQVLAASTRHSEAFYTVKTIHHNVILF